MTKIILNEIFGPTIQGEGPHMGQNSLFLRTFGCSLGCYFCDTAYSWRTNENRPHAMPDVYDMNNESWQEHIDGLVLHLEEKWEKYKFHRLIITGGEPLLQKEAMDELIGKLKVNIKIDFETAGFIMPQMEAFLNDKVSFNVSPKLSNSQVDYDKRINPNAIIMFIHHPRSIFKFVVNNESHIDEVIELRNRFRIPDNKIWLMPQCLTYEEHINRDLWVAQTAIHNHWNYSPRLHVLLWSNKRGV